jgi:hypothetical protein
MTRSPSSSSSPGLRPSAPRPTSPPSRKNLQLSVVHGTRSMPRCRPKPTHSRKSTPRFPAHMRRCRPRTPHRPTSSRARSRACRRSRASSRTRTHGTQRRLPGLSASSVCLRSARLPRRPSWNASSATGPPSARARISVRLHYSRTSTSRAHVRNAPRLAHITWRKSSAASTQARCRCPAHPPAAYSVRPWAPPHGQTRSALACSA